MKVQRAIVTTEKHTPVLIYNQDRSVLIQQAATPDIMKLFDKGEFKLYADAELDSGQLVIGKRVPAQPW